MSNTLKKLAFITSTLILSCMHHSEAFAQSSVEELLDMDEYEVHGGYGHQHYLGVSLTHARHSNFKDIDTDDNDTTPQHNYGVLAEAGALPFRTLFGSEGGVEASLGLGYPFLGSFFGGIRASLGLMIVPVPLGPLRLSVSAGAAIGGHRRLYVKPQAALKLGPIELAGSYTWNPHKASRVWDNGGPPGTYGVKEETMRLQLWFITDEDPDDGEPGMEAIHLYLEKTTLSTPTPEILEQKHIRQGSYFSGGAGLSF